MINIAELINDPDFCQPNGINITRSVYSVVDHVPVKTSQEMNVVGIITINSENSDELLDEVDRNSESINIFTYNRLMTVGVDKLTGINFAADIIHFNGADYIVRKCLDDAQYGFCKSVAVKMRQDVM